MISKILQHEFKRTWKWLALVALAVALMVGVGLVGGFLLPGPLNVLLAGLGMVIAIASPMAVQLLLGLDFYRSSYSKTGYFTMTLPVRGSTTFWAKFSYAGVVALLFFAYGLTMALVSGLALTRATTGTADGYWRAVGDAATFIIDNAPVWLLVLGGLLILLLPLSGLVQYFFAATVGSETTFNRMGFGGVVLVWFLYYVASQLVSLLGLLLPLSFAVDASGVSWLRNPLSLFTMDGTDAVLPLGAFVASYILAAVAIWRAKVSFEEKLELR